MSFVGSFVTDLIAGPVIGALPSSKFVVLWAVFMLVMTAVAFSTAALQTLFGPAGTLIVVVLFVIFGAPAAGGTVPSAFLPEFWRVIGPYLPAGAGTTAVRNTIYFGGNEIALALVVLAVYLVVGAVVVVAIRRRVGAAPSGGGRRGRGRRGHGRRLARPRSGSDYRCRDAVISSYATGAIRPWSRRSG